jgi:hypothetical protein
MIIDALRVMLEDDEISKRVVVMAAIDERVLKRAIKWKYHDLLQKDYTITDDTERIQLSHNISGEYMDKLFLSGINLGTLTSLERQAILSNYIGARVYRPEKATQSTTPAIKEEEENKPNPGPINEVISKLVETSQDQLVKIQIDERKYDLTQDEELMLASRLEYADNLTPRQIRIFYYRYLLARNILHTRSAHPNTPPGKSQLQNLAGLLMHYTLMGDLNSIRKNKLGLIKEEGEGTDFKLFGKDETFKRAELIALHEILEIVVAY